MKEIKIYIGKSMGNIDIMIMLMLNSIIILGVKVSKKIHYFILPMSLGLLWIKILNRLKFLMSRE